MRSHVHNRSRKVMSSVVAACFLCVQMTCVLPTPALAGADTDLKNIEYKQYFRGDYQKAIAELQAFLAREDLTAPQVVEAREYLAASLILSGASEQGKAQYLTLLKMDPSYAGPDPSVFKAVIVSTFNEAKAEYASVMIRTAPESKKGRPATTAGVANDDLSEGKPIYKKWWFYATMGAVLLAIGGAAGGDKGSKTPSDRGTVSVGVKLP